MNDALEIRPATEAHAEAACGLVRASIIGLCKADHLNDTLTLQGWLANKTPDNVRHWLTAPGMNAFLAVRDGYMLGVGAVRDDGEIVLAYVHPHARFQGVTKALVAHMEAVAREKLAERMSLTTTETARPFFEARGYVAEDAAGDLFNDEQCVLIKKI
jgi:GNAT superfamily N-acetyltransferase